jgi:serine phosphatase RsbU (regulator of sigma subunit)
LNQDAAEIVKRASVFSALSYDEARRLAQRMEEVALAMGECAFMEGEPGDRFYIVAEGQVEVVKALGTEEQRRLTVRAEGDYFGEMSLLDPAGLRTATVRALVPTRLLSLSREHFQALLTTHPSLAYEMVRVLTLQLRDSNNATITDLRRKNTDLAAAYMELKAAQAQLIEKEKLEQELRTAQRIQQSILPGELPRLRGYDFGAVLMPARTVGGDLYDFIPLGRDRLGIAVGDVSDKGIPAAIFMALTRSLLRAEATRNRLRPRSPRQALERVNSLLLDMNQDGMFVTLLYGILDTRSGLFTYARAGHELPLLVRERDGFSAMLVERGRGVPLGLFDPATLEENTIQLLPRDTLLLYTDGATDMADSRDVLFGIERLQEAARQAARRTTAQAFCDEIWGRLAQHRGASVQADDVALVSLRSA